MGSDFGEIAQRYDREFTATPIGKAQREVVWRLLRKQLNNKVLNILETNCGTGEDALFLVQLGHHVTLSDRAEQMLQEADQKLKANNQHQFSLLEWDLRNPFPLADKKYDLIFSNFGGYNCLDALELLKLSVKLHAILNPGGRIIAVVMGRKCIWERWYFKRKKNAAARNRRKSEDPVSASLGDGNFVQTWYYSPKEICALFPDFKLTQLKPVGLFIPPSYLNPYFANKKWLLNILKLKERLFPFAIFSNYADHFMITLQKK